MTDCGRKTTNLFGSKERGDITSDSDIDVLVILKDVEGQTSSQILTTAPTRPTRWGGSQIEI
ncbi:MAG: nucleotidyltransferase domain-containing protein [Chloroflexi bacterium]|nr:nucleotidyltransferase domain-containing protein [Chloroflexota bacterium]